MCSVHFPSFWITPKLGSATHYCDTLQLNSSFLAIGGMTLKPGKGNVGQCLKTISVYRQGYNISVLMYRWCQVGLCVGVENNCYDQ